MGLFQRSTAGDGHERRNPPATASELQRARFRNRLQTGQGAHHGRFLWLQPKQFALRPRNEPLCRDYGSAALEVEVFHHGRWTS